MEGCSTRPDVGRGTIGARRAVLGASVGWLGVSMVSDGVPTLLLPYMFAAAGAGGATQVGVTGLVAIAAAALVQPLAGAWSDRIGRVSTMAAGVVVAGIGLLLIPQPGAVVIGAVVALAGVSIVQAGQQALLPDVAPRARRGRGGGLKSAFDVAGALVAFSALAAVLGRGETVVAAALLGGGLLASVGLAALLLWPVRRQLRGATAPVVGSRTAIGSTLVAVAAGRFLFLLGIYAVGRFLLLFVGDRAGVSAEASAEQAGVALTVLAAVTVVASVPAGWLADRFGRRAVMVTGGVLAALGIALMPTASSLEQIMAFGCAMALGSAAFSAGSWAALADAAEGPWTGRLLGLANFGTAGAAAGAGAFGVIVDDAGYGAAFGVAALCALAGGLVASLRGGADRREEPIVGSAEGTS